MSAVVETCEAGHKHGRILEGEYQGCPVCLRDGMNRARDEVDSKGNQINVLKGMHAALKECLKESNDLKEQYKEEIATLSTYKEAANELLKRSLSFAFNDEYVDKVELLLWGPCDHDFGGKCPRCYPSMRK